MVVGGNYTLGTDHYVRRTDVKLQCCTHEKKKPGKEFFLEEISLELKLKRSTGIEGDLSGTHQTSHLQKLEKPIAQLEPVPREAGSCCSGGRCRHSRDQAVLTTCLRFTWGWVIKIKKPQALT